jgi:enoyl-CoA hydratase/carnithine racemase
MEMILLADIIDAQEALRIGLVNRVVPAEQLKLAERLAQDPTVAYGLAKTGFYQGLGMSLEDAVMLASPMEWAAAPGASCGCRLAARIDA